MAKQRKEQTSQLGNSYVNLIVGIIVVVAIAAVIVGLIRSRALPGQQPQETQQAQGIEEQVSLPAKHKVAAGEDLWKISEKYYKTGYNWVDIAQENKLANPNELVEGMELTIPNVSPKVEATAAATPPAGGPAEAPKAEEPGAITGNVYAVVAGDHLWGIAVRAYGDGYKWVEIARANKLANPDLIHPGNQLTLPR